MNLPMTLLPLLDPVDLLDLLLDLLDTFPEIGPSQPRYPVQNFFIPRISQIALSLHGPYFT